MPGRNRAWTGSVHPSIAILPEHWAKSRVDKAFLCVKWFLFFMKHLVFQNNLSPGRRRPAQGAMGEPRKQGRNVSSSEQPA